MGGSRGYKEQLRLCESAAQRVAIADGAGEYLRRFRKSYALNIGDAVIAATAKEMGMKLVTRNIKHHPMKDIDIVKPY